MNKFIFVLSGGLGVALLISLVLTLLPLKTVAYTALVDYQDTETYYENEPYQDTETYSEAAPLSYDAVKYVKEDTINQRSQIIIGGVVFEDKVVAVPIYIASVDVKTQTPLLVASLFLFLGLPLCLARHH